MKQKFYNEILTELSELVLLNDSKKIIKKYQLLLKLKDKTIIDRKPNDINKEIDLKECVTFIMPRKYRKTFGSNKVYYLIDECTSKELLKQKIEKLEVILKKLNTIKYCFSNNKKFMEWVESICSNNIYMFTKMSEEFIDYKDLIDEVNLSELINVINAEITNLYKNYNLNEDIKFLFLKGEDDYIFLTSNSNEQVKFLKQDLGNKNFCFHVNDENMVKDICNIINEVIKFKENYKKLKKINAFAEKLKKRKNKALVKVLKGQRFSLKN